MKLRCNISGQALSFWQMVFYNPSSGGKSQLYTKIPAGIQHSCSTTVNYSAFCPNSRSLASYLIGIQLLGSEDRLLVAHFCLHAPTLGPSFFPQRHLYRGLDVWLLKAATMRFRYSGGSSDRLCILQSIITGDFIQRWVWRGALVQHHSPVPGVRSGLVLQRLAEHLVWVFEAAGRQTAGSVLCLTVCQGEFSRRRLRSGGTGCPGDAGRWRCGPGLGAPGPGSVPAVLGAAFAVSVGSPRPCLLTAAAGPGGAARSLPPLRTIP